jgi:hypothetical protein
MSTRSSSVSMSEVTEAPYTARSRVPVSTRASRVARTKRTHSLCLSAKLVVDVDKLATRLEGQAAFGKRDLAASQDRYRTLLGRLDDFGDAFESLLG